MISRKASRLLSAVALLSVGLLLAESARHDVYASTPYTSDVRLRSLQIARDFSVDGDLSKRAWRNAESMEFDHDAPGKQNFPNVRTRVASLWTKDYVYFAFWCHYQTLNTFEGEDPLKERWELWNRDVAEVFLNPQPDHVNHYYEFEIAPNNQWIDLEIDKDKTPFNDATWNSGYDHATHIDENNKTWTAELRIPVASMKAGSLQAQSQWRANFFRAAGPGGDTVRQFMAWSTIPDGKTFHVPSRFGILEFVEKSGAPGH